MDTRVIGAIIGVIFEAILIGVFVNEVFKLVNSATNANLAVLVLSVIGIIGIASLIVRLFSHQ
jgi:hypothetical protein